MDVNDIEEEERESPTEQTALEKPVGVPHYMKNVPVKKIHHPMEKSIVPTVIVSTVFVVGGLAFGLPIVVVVTVAVMFVGLVRLFIAFCCASRLGHGFAGCTGFMSATDAFWLHDSNFNRYVAHCLFFVERGLDVRMTREIIMSRVIEKTTDDGAWAFARFTQKVVSASSGYFWVDDAEFDIEKHVFEEAKRVRTRQQLRDLVSSLMSNPLAPNKPLWEVRMIKDYGRARDTVLIVRVHHALGDGVTLVKILGNFLADNPQMLRLKPRIGGTTFPLNVFRAAVVAPLTLLTWLCTRRDYNPVSHRQPLSGKRTVGWSSSGIRYAMVDRIRQVTHCSVNDVLMAAARGAIRDYFKQHCGLHSPPDVTVNVPLDLRYEPTSMETFPELGTGFTTVNTRLPTNTEGAIPGLWAVKRRMSELKGSCDPVVMYSMIHYLMILMPSCLCRWLVRSVLRCATLRFCSLPGPERTVTLASSKLKAVTFWMDAHPDVPVAFCVFSYAGCFYVGVSADSGTIASPKVLIKGFARHLDRMYGIVSKRKIPGQERRRSSFTVERRREEIFKPSVKEINCRLHAVQDELHEISRKLEVTRMPGYSHPAEYPPVASYQNALHLRAEELKEEFVELITELRKRRTGSVAVDVEAYDHDLDGELRRPPKWTSQASRRPSLTALTTLLSTSRPLITAPQQQLYCVPSDPDLEMMRTTPEQQRALLARRNDQDYQEFYLSRNVGSKFRRDKNF
ncbi:hypothetical protein JTE90_017724 [Oedothorax gibbosus]|uniref:Diacylglycerol O-acyltransferase n=1 Tax=Oedothorax gibbosus TaxID=931172 RepID=A0AAV6UC62_9ARAC|nr:hypothetical protein JTE90_017724 [Oedothorax gibbosus]